MSHPGFAPRVLSFLALGLAAACSAAPVNTFDDAGVGGTGNRTNTGTDIIITGSGGSGSGGNNACAAEPHQAQQLPLDMYIMLDQSGSMDDPTGAGPTKWDAVSSALNSFIQQPSLAGISVGIQFFPILQPNCPVYCQSPSDTTTCGTWGPCMDASGFGLGPFVCQSCYFQVQDSCAAADYAKPEVEIAPLPGIAAKITAAIAKHGPATATPTEPALQGAITHAQTWLANHPGHAAVAVLATDGLPTECGVAASGTAAQIQSSLVQIAQQGLGNGVKTFTIGIFGTADGNDGKNLLNAVSQAGGTGQTFSINTGGNVNQQFLDALNKIRGAALGCNYTIPVPASGTPDFNRVNVQYTPGGSGNAQVFPYYGSKAQCPASGDGWFYDNAAAPTQIILCPSTCTKVSADTAGKIDILLGCATQIQ